MDLGVRHNTFIYDTSEDREERIRHLEFTLGIHGRPTLYPEASLFIDSIFSEAATIAHGEKIRFERLFGHEEWEGYLRARVYTLANIWEELSPDFVLEVHRCFAQRQFPDEAGIIYEGEPYTGGFFDSSGVFLPVIYKPEQVEAIKTNPFLEFEPADQEENTGIIHYVLDNGYERAMALDWICNWYNQTYADPQYDAHRRAALLERMLVSAHVLPAGINGRVARTLMNWSLARDGLSPSAIEEFDNDIITSEEEWTEQVAAGCLRHESMYARCFAGDVTPQEVLGTTRTRQLYLERREQIAVPSMEYGAIHYRPHFKAFIDAIMRSTVSAGE